MQKQKYTYDYPMFSLTTDCVVFSVDLDGDGALRVLLMQRENEPFAGKWALPGVYVQIDEDPAKAAMRALRTKTGLKQAYLEQLYTFGAPKRDPRGRVVSCAYYALVKPHEPSVEAGSLSLQAKWFALDEIPKLAFDHKEILSMGLDRLRGKLSYAPVGIELLPEEFTIPELRTVYEAILGRELDRRNFQKRILAVGLLIETDERKESGELGGRRAKLYRFDKEAYKGGTKFFIHLGDDPADAKALD